MSTNRALHILVGICERYLKEKPSHPLGFCFYVSQNGIRQSSPVQEYIAQAPPGKHKWQVLRFGRSGYLDCPSGYTDERAKFVHAVLDWALDELKTRAAGDNPDHIPTAPPRVT